MKHKGSFDYCCNGQISVDSKNQIIVSQHLSQNENDKNELVPALADTEKNTGAIPDKKSLDSGYATADNICTLSDSKIDAYTVAGRGEKDNLADNARKIGKSHFLYDNQKDEFICPAGVVLKLKSSGKNIVYKVKDKVYTGCIYQKRCNAKRGNVPTIYTNDKGIIF